MNKIIKKIIILSLFFPLSLILAEEVNDRKKLSIQKMEKRKHFSDKNQTKKNLRGIPLFPGARRISTTAFALWSSKGFAVSSSST